MNKIIVFDPNFWILVLNLEERNGEHSYGVYQKTNLEFLSVISFKCCLFN
jgi:hypothetical protein